MIAFITSTRVQYMKSQDYLNVTEEDKTIKSSDYL